MNSYYYLIAADLTDTTRLKPGNNFTFKMGAMTTFSELLWSSVQLIHQGVSEGEPSGGGMIADDLFLSVFINFP